MNGYRNRCLMRRVALVSYLLMAMASPLLAQEPPPRIGPIVLDLHGTVPRFPENDALALSRGISVTELPGTGLGVQAGLHLYFFRWRAITFGIGGDAVVARAKQTPAATAARLQQVTEQFRTLGSQLSFNFGSGNGWSYISGGIGRSNWSVVPENRTPLVADDEALKTVNYGGGARWFIRSHLAFSFDVRFYALNPGSPSLGFPPSPRTTLLVVGAGVSVKP
jgi:hypothetical protein